METAVTSLNTPESPILSVRGLTTHFVSGRGVVRAVSDVSFDVRRGETLGIVGESGSGKSVTAASLMRLNAASSDGSIIFDGDDLLALNKREMQQRRGRQMAMVFQDPFLSLNPYLKVSKQLTDVTRRHLGHTKREARSHAVKMVEAVGIADAERRIDSYPHEFSGGMRQRVMIAMALSCNPSLLIADEPTTALDVTIQAQIVDLIKELTAEKDTSVILITHDLGVIAEMAETTLVMYAGRIFEKAPTTELFARPANPYTVGLLGCIPRRGEALRQIPGGPPDMTDLPVGCPFAPRCYRAEEICREEFPPLVQINAGHQSLCHFASEIFEAN